MLGVGSLGMALARKFENSRKHLPAPVAVKNGTSKIGFLAYGSTDFALRESLDQIGNGQRFGEEFAGSRMHRADDNAGFRAAGTSHHGYRSVLMAKRFDQAEARFDATIQIHDDRLGTEVAQSGDDVRIWILAELAGHAPLGCRNRPGDGPAAVFIGGNQYRRQLCVGGSRIGWRRRVFFVSHIGTYALKRGMKRRFCLLTKAC